MVGDPSEVHSPSWLEIDFDEGGKPEDPKKNSQSRVEIELSPLSIAEVGGAIDDHYAILTPLGTSVLSAILRAQIFRLMSALFLRIFTSFFMTRVPPKTEPSKEKPKEDVKVRKGKERNFI